MEPSHGSGHGKAEGRPRASDAKHEAGGDHGDAAPAGKPKIRRMRG
jgi:hypothetical protein